MEGGRQKLLFLYMVPVTIKPTTFQLYLYNLGRSRDLLIILRHINRHKRTRFVVLCGGDRHVTPAVGRSRKHSQTRKAGIGYTKYLSNYQTSLNDHPN